MDKGVVWRTRGVDERIDESVFRWLGHVIRWIRIGFVRESMYESVMVVTQWVGRGRDGLIS